MYCIRKSSQFFIRRFPITQVSTVSCIEMHSWKPGPKYLEENEYLERKKMLINEFISTRQLHGNQQKSNIKNVGEKVWDLVANVPMKELHNAPKPMFWYGVAGLIPVAGTPILSLIFGHSYFLSSVQLTFAATVLAFLGGIKWGYALPPKSVHQPTWENLSWAVAPQCIAVVGLLLPQVLGYLTIISGLMAAAYIDLTTAAYPLWFQALRLALTVPVVIALFLSFLSSLFRGSAYSL